jgi:hypothetical protein
MTNDEISTMFNEFIAFCITKGKEKEQVKHHEISVPLTDDRQLIVYSQQQYCFIDDIKGDKKLIQYEMDGFSNGDRSVKIAAWKPGNGEHENYFHHDSEQPWWDFIAGILPIETFIILVQQKWIELT